MIMESPYDNPDAVGYQSAIHDDERCIGFRKLDGSIVPLFVNGITSADIRNAIHAGLHDLESSEGLFVHDGDPKETFALRHASVEQMRLAFASLV